MNHGIDVCLCPLGALRASKEKASIVQKQSSLTQALNHFEPLFFYALTIEKQQIYAKLVDLLFLKNLEFV